MDIYDPEKHGVQETYDSLRDMPKWEDLSADEQHQQLIDFGYFE